MSPGPPDRQPISGASDMAGALTFDALKGAVAAGDIDTVLVCLVDMQGRLIGKRFDARYFVEAARCFPVW